MNTVVQATSSKRHTKNMEQCIKIQQGTSTPIVQKNAVQFTPPASSSSTSSAISMITSTTTSSMTSDERTFKAKSKNFDKQDGDITRIERTLAKRAIFLHPKISRSSSGSASSTKSTDTASAKISGPSNAADPVAQPTAGQTVALPGPASIVASSSSSTYLRTKVTTRSTCLAIVWIAALCVMIYATMEFAQGPGEGLVLAKAPTITDASKGSSVIALPAQKSNWNWIALDSGAFKATSTWKEHFSLLHTTEVIISGIGWTTSAEAEGNFSFSVPQPYVRNVTSTGALFTTKECLPISTLKEHFPLFQTTEVRISGREGNSTSAETEGFSFSVPQPYVRSSEDSSNRSRISFDLMGEHDPTYFEKTMSKNLHSDWDEVTMIMANTNDQETTSQMIYGHRPRAITNEVRVRNNEFRVRKLLPPSGGQRSNCGPTSFDDYDVQCWKCQG